MKLSFVSQKTRAQRAAQLAEFTAELILENLEQAGGKLEVLPDGRLKLIGTGHLPAVWHEAFGIHRTTVLKLVQTKAGD